MNSELTILEGMGFFRVRIGAEGESESFLSVPSALRLYRSVGVTEHDFETFDLALAVARVEFARGGYSRLRVDCTILD